MIWTSQPNSLTLNLGFVTETLLHGWRKMTGQVNFILMTGEVLAPKLLPGTSGNSSDHMQEEAAVGLYKPACMAARHSSLE